MSSRLFLAPGVDRRHRGFLARALDAIDAVHGDGPLPNLRVEVSTTGPEFYEAEKGTGAPVRIVFNRKGPHPELTLLHEIGHFLDHHALADEHGIGSGAPATAPARAAIVESRTFKLLVALSRDRTAIANLSRQRSGGRITVAEVERHASNEETFVRAYAQYVAHRSQKPELLKQLQARRSGQATPLGPFLQWTDEEFEPIAREFDLLFRKRGWKL